jgi:hypothetical protein
MGVAMGVLLQCCVQLAAVNRLHLASTPPRQGPSRSTHAHTMPHANQVIPGLPRPLVKICDFGYSKHDNRSMARSKVVSSRGELLSSCRSGVCCQRAPTRERWEWADMPRTAARLPSHPPKNHSGHADLHGS